MQESGAESAQDQVRGWHDRFRTGAAVLACASLAISAAKSEATPPSEPNRNLTQVTHPHRSHYCGKAVVIASEPQGYPIGNAIYGNSVNVSLVSYSGNYAFGLIGKTTCGWVETSVLDTAQLPDPKTNACKPYLDDLKDRSKFGKGFNGKPGQYNDGTFATPLTKNCNRRAYYNFSSSAKDFSNVVFPSGDEGFNDYAGRLRRNEKVHYRYTSLDSRAAMVRSDRKGWVFISKSCIEGYPQGGPVK